MARSTDSTQASKIVIVAGGTGGLGRAVSLAFLNQGDTVAVSYRNQAEFDGLRSVSGKDAKLEGQSLDVTDESASPPWFHFVARRSQGHAEAAQRLHRQHRCTRRY